MYSFLADLTAVFHATYILFVLGGQVLILIGWWGGWVWPRNRVFRIAHLCAIGFVVMETYTGVSCPLTVLENQFRRLAGSPPYESGFISYWIDWLIYYTAPEWVFTLAYTLFSVVVLVTFIAYPPERAGK